MPLSRHSKGHQLACCLLAVANLLLAQVARAHHSMAMYDLHQKVTLNGTVTEFQWTNPHSWVDLQVPNGSGASDAYGIEAGTPRSLARYGWNKHSLKPGDKVALVINPRRDRSRGGRLLKVVFPDGHVLSTAPSLEP